MTARSAWGAWIGIAVVGLGLAGCAATGRRVKETWTGGDRPPESPFPTRAALETLGPAPSEEQMSSLDMAAVEKWDLAGPFPERIGVVPAAYRGGFGGELVTFAQQRKGRLLASADMACVARESGRFLLDRDTLPPGGLQRHIGGRCGSPGVRHRVLSLSGEVPERATEEDVLAHWKDGFAKLMGKIPGGPETRAAGVWFGHRGKKAIIALAVADLEVDLETLAFAPAADGTVAVTGALVNQSGRLEALVTRGRTQYAVCEADPATKLPRFSFRCPVNHGDPSAWVSLFVFPPDQVLGTVAVDLLVFPQGKGSSTYARPVLRAPPGAPEEAGARFASLLNGLRAEQGLAPLALSEGESRVATKIAPHYFASMFGLAPKAVADTVALGMLAGWEVEQVTRGAYFSDWVGSGDVGSLLAEMLETPGARRTLFEPHVRAMAFGTFRLPSRGVLGALVTTYAPFEEQPQGAEARQVMDALNKARAEKGLGPAKLVALPADTRTEMDEALARGGSARDALQVVMQRAVNLTSRNVQGSVVQAGMLEKLPFPEELLRRPQLVVFVAVTHYKPRWSPWGLYVIALAYTEQVGQTA